MKKACRWDPEVATVNSSLELTVGSSSKEKPTVTRAVTVATCYPLLRGFGGSGISMKSYPPGVAPSTLAIIAAPYYRPDIGAEDDQSEFSARQVLLIPDVLIGRKQHFEASFFRHSQKLAVFQLVGPLHFDESLNLMLEQEAAHTDRDIFI